MDYLLTDNLIEEDNDLFGATFQAMSADHEISTDFETDSFIMDDSNFDIMQENTTDNMTITSEPKCYQQGRSRKQKLSTRNVDAAAYQAIPSRHDEPRKHMYQLNPDAPNINKKDRQKILHAIKSKDHRTSVKEENEFYKNKCRTLEVENCILKLKVEELEGRFASLEMKEM